MNSETIEVKLYHLKCQHSFDSWEEGGVTFDIIVLGHLTHDVIVTPDKRVHKALGGVTAYTSLAADKLGATVGIVAKVGADFAEDYLRHLLKAGVDLRGLRVENGKTTTFINAYDESGRRTQKILSHAGPIGVRDIHTVYFHAKCFHFGPVFHEISYNLIKVAHDKGILTSLDPQGYCREQGPNHIVRPQGWRAAEEVLPYVSILKCDETEAEKLTDMHDLSKAAKYINSLGPKIVLITQGIRGSLLYHESELKRIPNIPPEKNIDPTGAGDAYAAGFLTEYLRTRDPWRSALFASCVASFVVEGIGVTTLPTRETVMRRLSTFLKRT